MIDKIQIHKNIPNRLVRKAGKNRVRGTLRPIDDRDRDGDERKEKKNSKKEAPWSPRRMFGRRCPDVFSHAFFSWRIGDGSGDTGLNIFRIK